MRTAKTLAGELTENRRRIFVSLLTAVLVLLQPQYAGGYPQQQQPVYVQQQQPTQEKGCLEAW